jgi:hypothetical protein
MRPAPSKFGVINSLMEIQSQVHRSFHHILTAIDPDGPNSDRPDLLIVDACAPDLAPGVLDELGEAVSHLQEENARLLGEITSRNPVRSRVVPEFDREQHLRLSHLKAEIDRQTAENEAIRLRIAGFERRIDLMKRKRSYVSDPGVVRRARPIL